MQVDQIISALKEKISNFKIESETQEFGYVQTVSDGIVKASGIDNCQMSEMIKFESGAVGLALNLEDDSAGIVVLGDFTKIKEGEKVYRTKKVLSIPVSSELLGRVVDPLMNSLDEKGIIAKDKEYPVEKIAPGVMHRQSVDQPLQTGIKVIDALVPVGRGQRELIIGDRQTGKTALAIDTILNQHDQNIICVYVAIGQKQSKISQTVEILKKAGAMKYTTIVLAGAAESAALLYLAPYAGVTIAEYFMDQGKDVLIIYDDLTKHAAAYREISLLLRRPPGREAYPGDVFYLHSRLLERACRRNKEHGGGSITALPIIETQAGDVSGYIPTNVISITDGQIFLESSLFYKGIRPAINPGLSVSRVGGSAQIKSMKKNAGKLKLTLAQYRELESFSQFDSDLDPATKKIIERGKKLTEVLKQNQFSPMNASEQVAIIYAVNNGYLDNIDLKDIKEFEKNLINFIKNTNKELLAEITKNWSDEIENKLKESIETFVASQS